MAQSGPESSTLALDRFSIDADLLTGGMVWSVALEQDNVYLFQEDDRGSLRAGDHAVLHDGDVDRIVKIGFKTTETRPDDVNGGLYDDEGYPLTDVQTGEEIDFLPSLPDPSLDRWTTLDMIN